LVILPPAGGFNQGTVVLTVTASNLDTDSTETETLSTSSSLTVTIHPGSTPIRGPDSPVGWLTQQTATPAVIGDGSSGLPSLSGDSTASRLPALVQPILAAIESPLQAAHNGDTASVLADVQMLREIALLGQYTAASFVMSADGFGGTLIHDVAPAILTPTLTQPHHA
jgi:hypothetical protein